MITEKIIGERYLFSLFTFYFNIAQYIEQLDYNELTIL